MSADTVVPLEAIARVLVNFCYSTVRHHGYGLADADLSIAKIAEIVNFAYRDLERLSFDLNAKVSREKFVAYHAFWFARIKPIRCLVRATGDEIVDINERLAVILAVEWMRLGAGGASHSDVEPYAAFEARDVGFDSPPAPLVWRQCQLECRGSCFEMAARNYLAYHDQQNFEYLVHSLRHRAAGPYVLVSVIEALVVASCKQIYANPPSTQVQSSEIG